MSRFSRLAVLLVLSLVMTTPAFAGSPIIDVNSASAPQLVATLFGIGPARAADRHSLQQ